MSIDDRQLQVEVTIVSANNRQRGRRREPGSMVPEPPAIPRLARLVALAIKFQAMVDGGEVRDYADLARLGYVTRARVTQIMNLLNLAPDIQQALLDCKGELRLTERDGRCMTRLVSWEEQRRLFHAAANQVIIRRGARDPKRRGPKDSSEEVQRLS
jgi:hypothetical protein